MIEAAIDKEAPSLLPVIRTKLHLKGDAFIIPSDVHDHLIDSGLLLQEQFVGVCGGNILDDGHLGSLLGTLAEEDADVRVAATLFFHEHVVSLHRLAVPAKDAAGGTDFSFDLIDSLPASTRFLGHSQGIGPPTLRGAGRMGSLQRRSDISVVTSFSGGNGLESMISSNPEDACPPARSPRSRIPPCVSGDDSPSDEDDDDDDDNDVPFDEGVQEGVQEEVQEEDTTSDEEEGEDRGTEGEGGRESSSWRGRATRIRCSDANSLRDALRWYAHSKFSEEDQRYISRCQWDDYKSDFDPRVFQAFVWKEGPRDGGDAK